MSQVSLIKIRTLQVDFQPLQIDSFLPPVRSLLGGALALFGEKRLVSGFSGQSIFQFTHNWMIRLLLLRSDIHPNPEPQTHKWVCDICLKTYHRTSNIYFT